jgi:hypothetical protein
MAACFYLDRTIFEVHLNHLVLYGSYYSSFEMARPDKKTAKHSRRGIGVNESSRQKAIVSPGTNKRQNIKIYPQWRTRFFEKSKGNCSHLVRREQFLCFRFYTYQTKVDFYCSLIYRPLRISIFSNQFPLYLRHIGNM